METIKIPGPMRMIWGSLGAWWLAYFLNPAFNAITIMLIFMIPVVVMEIYFASPAKTNITTPQRLSPDNSAQEDSA